MTMDITIARDTAITAVKRWFDDIWSKQDMQAVDELLVPEFAYVLSLLQTRGRDTFKRIRETNHGAFEHLPYVAGEIIVDGNTTAARRRMHTTKHWATWNNVEAIGNTASISGMPFFAFANCRMTGGKIRSDVYSLMRQLDAIK